MTVTPLRRRLGDVLTPKSIPIQIRDSIVDRIKTWPWFANFTFTTNKSMQIQEENIPFCGVYFIDQQMTPDGDANVGETRFRTTVRIGFSVIVQNNDMVQAEYHLDNAFILITEGLFNDHTLYNWSGSGSAIQAFIRGVRTHQFGAIGENNETPIAELRFDLTADLGVITYPPVIEDEFRTIHVETAFPPGGDTSAVQQVKVQYDLPQGYTYNLVRRFGGVGSLKVDAIVV